MDPFSLPNNTRLRVVNATPQRNLSVAAPSAPPRVTVGPPPKSFSVPVSDPFTPPNVNVSTPNFGTFDFPDLDYEKVNYFIADGSQINPGTGKPFKINTPVFEGPDYLTESKEFKEKVEPLIEQPIQGFDDSGKPIHALNSKEFKEAIDDFVVRQQGYRKVKSELRENFEFNEKAGETYIEAFNKFKQTGQVVLPDGRELGITDIKAEFEKMDDLSRGSLLDGYLKIAQNVDADPGERGRALAAVDAIRDAKLLHGNEKAGYFAGTVGAGLVKGAYSLLDTVTPDRLANIAKFDESNIGKKMIDIQSKLENLDGYSATFKAGEITGVVVDAAASLLTGRALSIPARLAAIKTIRTGADILKATGVRASLAGATAEDVALLDKAGDSFLNASKTADKLADWTGSSEVARQVIRTPIESITFDALNNEDNSFGQHWLRNALAFTAADAALLGLVRTYRTATEASRRITAEGMSVQKFDELNSSIFQDGDDAIKFITADTTGSRPIYKTVSALENRTDDVLSANNSLKGLMESATLGLVDRFKAVTPTQAGELIIKGHQKGEVNKILGDELGKSYSGIRETLRKHLNRTGLKVDNIDEYIFRSGVVGKRVAGRAPSDIKTVATAEGERVIDTGGELLTREGQLQDVGIGNTILNYVRQNMGAAINRLTAARLIQSGTVIREAAPGSTAYRAATKNGGIIKIIRDVDGKDITTGYVATREWLNDTANGLYQQVERNNPMIGDALNVVKKNSKNFTGGFYATTEDLQKITNYATRKSDDLRQGMIAQAARLFEKGQDLVLSGGIPFTPVNSFGIAQMMAAMGADPLGFPKYAKAFANSISKGQTRKFWLDKLYSEPGKANLVDMQKNGINIIPRNLFSEASEEAGIRLAKPQQQKQFFTLKEEIGESKAATLTKLQKDEAKLKTKLDEANTKLAQAELRTSKTPAAALKRRQTSVTTAQKKYDDAVKATQNASKEIKVKEDLLKDLEQGFQEGNVAFDLLEATGNPHINNLKGVGRDLGEVYDRAIADATFQRFMPMLQYLTTESIVNKALKGSRFRAPMGMADAYAEGAKSLKRFWNIGPEGSYGSIQAQLGATTNERKQILSDIATILITAPKYRAAVINRVWNTLKAFDPRKMGSLEYRLNVQWAATMLTFFVGWQIANKSINGRYTWQNPTGSFDELQIPLGDSGEILRLSLFGTQLSFPRAIGRTGLAAARGDTEEFAQGLLGMGSVVGQPAARVVLNKTWTGEPVSESNLASPKGVIDRAGFLLSQYLGHPLIKGSQQVDKGNLLKGLLGAIESPVRLSNVDVSAKGEFFGQVCDCVGIVRLPNSDKSNVYTFDYYTFGVGVSTVTPASRRSNRGALM